MKQLGVILSLVAAFQFIAGEARLCCCWVQFLPSTELSQKDSKPDNNPSFKGLCSNCPQSPAQTPSGACSCGSLMAAESRPTEAIMNVSQERWVKTVYATAPPIDTLIGYEAFDTPIHLSQHPPLQSCAAYIRNSTLLI